MVRRLEELEKRMERLERILVGEKGDNGLRYLIYRHESSLYGDERTGHTGLVWELKLLRRWAQGLIVAMIVMSVIMALGHPQLYDVLRLLVDLFA